MRDSIYSNETADTEASNALESSSIVDGVVDALLPERGRVRVRIGSSHKLCTIQDGPSGDEWYPSVGEAVIVARKSASRSVILGSQPNVDINVGEGERVVGHSSSDTKLYFTENGTIEVYYDGDTSPTLTIDDQGLHFADKQVMTDVNTTTDADGHVTSVDPVYTTTISL